ncbi:MAG TPA: cobyric acid synthase [Candidatus Limnocylindria bacterium]|nr:cobyric acid synthase [Candidatus Limnocylindria bacterium]
MTRLARCVMVQGTSSDVGKSVVATALCRVLRDEGYRVAPFKAQNMSLNAAVTPDGSEIGRAQAAQAEAAGIVPRAEMNPILLKPEGDARSQLIVLGHARGSVAARDYWTRRRSLWPVVRSALRSLRAEYEVVVIEGAGSAAELNLRASDLANMRVARATRAAVLLVGDIERGGIFAQLLGTLALLPPAERALVRGILVNKFRGDPALFASGARLLARRAGVPVLGVLPYRDDLGVPAEDSLALDRERTAPDGALDVAVLRYPRISNFDDFEPFSRAGARVRYVRDAAALGTPDLLVLPGSKSTIADLEWLRDAGLGARACALADAGVPVVGVCGGFQMLGEVLDDRDGVEGDARRVRGLGLLPVRTVFRAAKRTVPARGTIAGDVLGARIGGLPVEGYELHAGATRRRGCAPFSHLAAGSGRVPIADGAVSADGRVFGTYLHGLFANAALRDALLARLAARRGASFAPRAEASDRYAALAAWLRASLSVPRLLRACEIAEARR